MLFSFLASFEIAFLRRKSHFEKVIRFDPIRSGRVNNTPFDEEDHPGDVPSGQSIFLAPLFFKIIFLKCKMIRKGYISFEKLDINIRFSILI